MLQTLTVSLAEYQVDYIKKQLTEGNYQSVDEIVLVALGLFTKYEAEHKQYLQQVAARVIKMQNASNQLKSLVVNLSKPLLKFVDKQIESENYQSASQIMAISVGLFMEYEAQRLTYVDEMKQKIREAKESLEKNKQAQGKVDNS